MTDFGSLSAVQARIAVITSHFAPAGSSPMYGQSSGSLAGPSDPTVGFDPFGDVYQQALQSAGVVPADGSAAPDGIETAGGAGSILTVVGGGGAAQSYAAAAGPVLSAGATSTVGALSGPVYTGGTSPSLGSYVAPSDYASVFGSSVGKTGGYGGMPVPDALRVYSNGQLPPEALESINQGPHRLWAPAAEGWKAAVAAARADGIDLRVTDSYRTFDEQVELAQRKGLYADGGLAAVPGTSNHGWGLAVDADITSPATMSWLRSNGYKYGFVEAVTREPWHWEFRPSQA